MRTESRGWGGQQFKRQHLQQTSSEYRQNKQKNNNEHTEGRGVSVLPALRKFAALCFF